MMLLDKIADTGSAVSTSRLNHFGFLSPVSGEERWADPIKKTPTKVIGATEARIYLAYTGRLSIAEMMDRYGNHTTQKTIVQNILNSAKPGAIDEIVDRNKNPFGQTKGMQLVRHFYNCRGTDLIYVKEK
jgi:N-methylhydantoinase B/oxoprolinase/acetone carboxylase alpha subunit